MPWKLGKPTLTVLDDGGPRGERGDVATARVSVRNGGTMPADASVLAFLSYLGPADVEPGPAPRATIADSGCTTKDTRTDLVQRLVGYQRTGELRPGTAKDLTFTLRLGPGSKSSWGGFGDPAPPCGAYVLRFGQGEPDAATFVLA